MSVNRYISYGKFYFNICFDLRRQEHIQFLTILSMSIPVKRGEYLNKPEVVWDVQNKTFFQGLNISLEFYRQPPLSRKAFTSFSENLIDYNGW